MDNRDTVAFEAAAEIVTRLGNDLDISVRRAVLQLYKERDRIIGSEPHMKQVSIREAAVRATKP
jgi:hypothetical protein